MRRIRRVISMDFEKVIPTLVQIETLYAQLKNRSHKISHKNLPSFDDHTNFVRHHPYREWVIVKDNGRAIGNLYIHFDNSIGLHFESSKYFDRVNEVLRFVNTSSLPLPAEPSVRIGEFFFRVSSDNRLLQEKLSVLGFREVERTFVPQSEDQKTKELE